MLTRDSAVCRVRAALYDELFAVGDTIDSLRRVRCNDKESRSAYIQHSRAVSILTMRNQAHHFSRFRRQRCSKMVPDILLARISHLHGLEVIGQLFSHAFVRCLTLCEKQFLSIPVYTIFKNMTIILIAYGEVLWFGGSVTPLTLVSFLLMVRLRQTCSLRSR